MDADLKFKGLDKLSRKILKELCENARVSNAEIGRRVGLSSPAVGERIQKLEEQGFIIGHHTAVDFDKVGLTIQAFITLKSFDAKHSDVVKFVDSLPQVIEWHSITGNVCVLLKVAVATSKELESIIIQLGEYGDTSTSLILSSSNLSNGLNKILDHEKV